jgi:thiol-disulfide isomerase/thioredoxin
MNDNKNMMSGSDMMKPEAMMDDKMMSGAMDDKKMMDDNMMKKDEAMMKPSGYINYDATQVSEALKAGQKVALFFHATWCPSCKALDKAINSSLSSIPADTLIVKVDFDSSTELKKKYRVVGQHTTVILNADGSEKSKKLGARSVAEIFE